MDDSKRLAQQIGEKDGKFSSGKVSTFELKPEPVRFNDCFHHFRYLIIVMSGLAMGIMLLLRMTIAVAMISMVNHTSLYITEHPNATASDLEEFFPNGYVETGDFDWTNEIQQTLMSGYMVAYTLPQYFTTRLTMRYGLNLGIPLSIAICSASNILTPVLSYFGWEFTLFLRLLNGIGASAILPSMINAIESWLTYKELAIGVALFQFTCTLLFVLSPLVSGFLTSIHWKWAFYVPGLIGMGFSFIWWIIVSDKPESSKFLSRKELDIINGVGEGDVDEKTGKRKDVGKVGHRLDLPWYFMFKMKQFYFLSLIWCFQCSTVGGFLFLLPTYMNRVLKVPVGEIGRVNFYVQIGAIFSMLWPHPVANYLQKHFKLSLSAARAIIVFICEAFVCITFSYLAVFHDDLIVTIFINRFFHTTNDTLVLATVMSQFGHAGVSGLVYSMINTVGNLSTVLFCWAVGKYLDYTGETLECWSNIYFIMVTMIVFYFLFYACCCPSTPVKVDMSSRKQTEDGAECK